MTTLIHILIRYVFISDRASSLLPSPFRFPLGIALLGRNRLDISIHLIEVDKVIDLHIVLDITFIEVHLGVGL